MTEIVLVRSGLPTEDPRVRKIISSLNKHYSLAVLGWNRERKVSGKINNLPPPIKLFGLKAPFGRPSLVFYFPIFWTWILLQLFYLRPQIVHACDLDTVVPCFIYKLMLRRKLIFEVFDRYAMVNVPRKYKRLYSIVNSAEDFFSKRADILVTVSEKLLKTFRFRTSRYAIVMNCPEDRTEISPKHNIFTVVYTGPIVKTRGLEVLAKAISELKDVRLVVAGRIYDDEMLKRISSTPNVQYEGVLSPTESLSLEGQADVMGILYDLRIPINNYAMPNKIFEAMMLSIPVVTNLAEEIINEYDCGIMVDYDDVNEVRQAIIKLRDDPELRHKLGKNGRKAFGEKYNWPVMEKEYYEIYNNLLGKS